jgi:16S rRNA (cytosine1402-N4)-methyltransferase
MDRVHLPVMPEEVARLLAVSAGGVYVDATVGPGGHSAEILRRAPGDIVLIGMDRDEEAIAEARGRIDDGRFMLRKARFSELDLVLGGLGIGEVRGVLFDLGVSMRQMKDSERGFSFNSDGPLDMRMDRQEGRTAGDVVNTSSEGELARIIWEYADERHSRKIARAIVRARRRKAIQTCRELADVVFAAVGRRGRIHPATKTFQALRVEVNDEPGELQAGLGKALAALAAGGRMVVISYHSLEDRAVKNFMREARSGGKVRVLTPKPLRPQREEVLRNPSSRSARLRALEAM